MNPGLTPEQVEAMERYAALRAARPDDSWVGYTVCKKCGVAIYLDPENKVDPFALHEAFHTRVEPR